MLFASVDTQTNKTPVNQVKAENTRKSKYMYHQPTSNYQDEMPIDMGKKDQDQSSVLPWQQCLIVPEKRTCEIIYYD